MTDTIFALCPAGAACWSMRLYHALFADAIPVLLADPVIEPFERFLDWTTFTVKVMTDPPPVVEEDQLGTHSSSDRSRNNRSSIMDLPALFDKLHEYSMLARQASSRKSSYVTEKVANIRQVTPWLTYNALSHRNAYRLILLEIWCRTKSGLSESACLRPVAKIANTSYF